MNEIIALQILVSMSIATNIVTMLLIRGYKRWTKAALIKQAEVNQATHELFANVLKQIANVEELVCLVRETAARGISGSSKRASGVRGNSGKWEGARPK